MLYECIIPNACPPLWGETSPKAGPHFKDDFTNNYSLISFDFSPPFLSWIEKHSVPAYLAILEADRLSAKNLGCGNATACFYNDIPAPLLNLKDKKTQIRWAVECFRHQFKRNPEGMRLPRNAADAETLEVLIENGVKFTILDPSLAGSFGKTGSGFREQISELNFDAARPYRWFSKEQNGKFLDLFFFNRDLTTGLPDEMPDSEKFFFKILKEFSDLNKPEFVSICGNGEIYGHKLKNGSHLLSSLLNRIKKEKHPLITNYSAFLEHYAPEYEIELLPACSEIKTTEALEWLSSELKKIYEEKAQTCFMEPANALNQWINLRRNPHSTETKKFLTLNAKKHLSGKDASKALSLLEMEKTRLSMLEDSGSGNEAAPPYGGGQAVHVLESAVRSIEIAETFDIRLEEKFMKKLSPDAGFLVKNRIKPSAASLEKAAANFAIKIFLNAFFPFEQTTRFRLRLIKEQRINSNSAFYLINIETYDLLERAEFIAFVQAGPVRCRIKEASNQEEYEELLLKPKNDLFKQVYDLSSLPEDEIKAISLLAACPPLDTPALDNLLGRREGTAKNETSEIILKWLRAIKHMSPSSAPGPDITDVFKEFRARSMVPVEIPYIDKAVSVFMTHFRYVLEKQPQDAAKFAGLFRTLNSGPWDNYLQEAKLAMTGVKGIGGTEPSKKDLMKELNFIFKKLEPSCRQKNCI